eukprot:861434-Rhodomonas_salina.1
MPTHSLSLTIIQPREVSLLAVHETMSEATGTQLGGAALARDRVRSRERGDEISWGLVTGRELGGAARDRVRSRREASHGQASET